MEAGVGQESLEPLMEPTAMQHLMMILGPEGAWLLSMLVPPLALAGLIYWY